MCRSGGDLNCRGMLDSGVVKWGGGVDKQGGGYAGRGGVELE